MELDAIDRKLLNTLQLDAKITHKELAQILGLSITPVHERIKRLTAKGYIDKYVALLNPEQAGVRLTVFCEISLKQHSARAVQAFQEYVNTFPEIMECYHMAGEHDFLLKILLKDMPAYQNFIVNRFGQYSEIDRIKSAFSLTRLKYKLQIEL